jgi:hypothetical protein
MCASPEYFYTPYPEPEYVGVPLEPPGPSVEYEDATQAGLSTAAIIASQSQDYVDEKLAEYQATIHQLQGRTQLSTIFHQILNTCWFPRIHPTFLSEPKHYS